MAIISSTDLDQRRLKMLFWGDTGTRKSETALRYLPNVLAIDTEGNLDQVIGMPEIPPFLLQQTKDIYEILDTLDKVAAGKIKMQNGKPVQTLMLDSTSVLWAVRQEVGALNAEKRAKKNADRYRNGEYNPDEVTMTQLDWVQAKRPLKRLSTRLANMPVPYLVLTAREKDQYEEKKDGNKTELVKVGKEPDAVKGLVYEVNLALHFQDNGSWFATVTKTQGALGHMFPKNSTLKEFPAKELIAYASQSVTAGNLQDDADVAERNLDKETTTTPARTQTGLVNWAKDTYGMNGTMVGAALKAAGITAFDANNWDNMVTAIKAVNNGGVSDTGK